MDCTCLYPTKKIPGGGTYLELNPPDFAPWGNYIYIPHLIFYIPPSFYVSVEEMVTR